MNLDQLQQYIDELVSHARQCQGSIMLNGETRNGLALFCLVVAPVVVMKSSFKLLKKVKGPNGYQRWECYLAAVWGQMSTDGGHSVLQESLSTLGIPVMSKSSFIHTERDIGIPVMSKTECDIGESWHVQLNK